VILVTGAAGKTGRAVVRALQERGAAVRALVYRAAQVQGLKQAGAQDVIVGDMRRPDTWSAATQGARAVYHICPNLSADEVAIGHLALDAARQAALDHFVYHSVLHPHIESMPHHWQKMRVEELLLESHLPFTILQPGAYMQNVLAAWDEIKDRGLYRVPYAIETRLGMVDLEDVAEAAAIVLTRPGHKRATYELAGPEAFTQSEVASILSQQLGRTIHVEVIPSDVRERQARRAGLDEHQVRTLVAMFRYYERFGFWGNPGVLEWLLGRPPNSFAGFVARALS
jgi:NAD(P)H dehydrogenase (quinone)